MQSRGPVLTLARGVDLLDAGAPVPRSGLRVRRPVRRRPAVGDVVVEPAVRGRAPVAGIVLDFSPTPSTCSTPSATPRTRRHSATTPGAITSSPWAAPWAR